MRIVTRHEEYVGAGTMTTIHEEVDVPTGPKPYEVLLPTLDGFVVWMVPAEGKR